MAAPSGTKWGSIVKGNTDGRQGRLGIYTSVSNTNTETTVNVQVWFWTIYTCDDINNTFYYNAGTSVSSATTSQGSVSIDHTVNSEWSTSNQTRLLNKTYTYTRGTSAVTYKVYTKLADISMLSGTVYANTTYTVPALASYTISYNANGGSGAPSNQTKWYGKTLTLSKTKPTRTGHSFQGWALDQRDAENSDVAYQAGETYTSNANATLYAVWKANTYTIKYDANGGTGAPSSQTKTYGVTLTLSSKVPTRNNYNFLGWGTAASATTATYVAGAKYTANTAVTLYAVWELAYVKPRITNSTISRCTLDATSTIVSTDDAENIGVRFSWACDNDVTSITIEWKKSIDDAWSDPVHMPASGKSGSVVHYIWADWDTSDELSAIVGADNYTNVDVKFSIENQYDFRITVTDTESSYLIRTVAAAIFPIDLLPENKGMAFGKPAELEGVCDVGYQTRLLGGLMYVLLPAETNLNDCHTPGFYIGENVSTYNYANCPLTSGTFTLEILSMGDNGQLMQRLTQCHISSPIVYERTYYKSAGWGEWFGGWIYPTINSEFAVYASDGVSSKPGCRKDGRTVEVRGIVKPTADIAGGTDMHTIVTLPVGYRPNSPIYVICQGSGNCTWLLRINTSGTVDFSRYRNGDATATASAGAWLPFQATYLV